MALKNLFKSLFGGNAGPRQPDPEENQQYKDFTISPTPIAEGSQYRTAGTISKQFDGELKSAQFVRADNHSSREMAVEHSITKAKQIVDERGDSVFTNSHC